MPQPLTNLKKENILKEYDDKAMKICEVLYNKKKIINKIKRGKLEIHIAGEKISLSITYYI